MIRRIAVIALVVLGLIVGAVGNLSGFLWWFVFDTNHFVSTVAPLSKDPAVAESVSTHLVDQAFAKYEVQNRIADALPKRAAFLAGPISIGAEKFAVDATERVIESDLFATTWRRALIVAHAQAMGILEGNHKVLESTNGKVVLNLQLVLQEVSDRLQERGIKLFDASQVSAKLPKDLGKIELIDNKQLGTTQQAVKLLRKLQFWLPIVSLALLGAAIALARNRRRTLLRVALAISFVALVEIAAIRLVRRSLLNRIADPATHKAVSDIWDTVVHRLRLGLWALVVFGVVVAVSAAFTGPGVRETRAREWVRRHIAALRSRTFEGETPDRISTVLSPWKRVLQALVLVGALLFLIMLSAVGPGMVIVTAIVVGLLLASIEFLVPSAG